MIKKKMKLIGKFESKSKRKKILEERNEFNRRKNESNREKSKENKKERLGRCQPLFLGRGGGINFFWNFFLNQSKKSTLFSL